MESYEAFIAFHPQTADEKMDGIIKKYEDRLLAAGAEVEKIDKLGKKRLPFRFQRHKGIQDANFVLISFKGEKKLPKIITDAIRITEEVVRFMVTKAQEKPAPEIEGLPIEEKTEIASSVLLDMERSQGE